MFSWFWFDFKKYIAFKDRYKKRKLQKQGELRIFLSMNEYKMADIIFNINKVLNFIILLSMILYTFANSISN